MLKINVTSVFVDDQAKAHAELTAAGVTFVQPPTAMGKVTAAVLDDTCGNLIMIAETAAGD